MMATIQIDSHKVEMQYEDRNRIDAYLDITLRAPVDQPRIVANHWTWHQRLA
jgi:hypothetical protein